MELLEQLSPAQRAAVTATEGYIRVIAGAGSGKTRVLAHRYAYLVGEMGILPENILCVTFTNKSAAEMKKRIRRLTGDADTGYISTFHSFCVSVLQEDIHVLQYPRNFIVLDNPDIDAMLKQIYDERGLTMRHMTFAQARDLIEMKKLYGEPDYYRAMLAMSVDELRERYKAAADPAEIIFWGYVYQEKKCFALDYNDLIVFVLHLFEVCDDVRDKWQDRLEYIMVDEYQDIDQIQYRLMRALCPRHNNLFIVGDPDQTIYTWRGASVRFILEFEREFPNVQTFLLDENYRSTPEILAVANDLIDKNRNRVKKELQAVNPAGRRPLYHHGRTQAEEAAWIAEQVRALAGEGVPLRDIAVLYRAHYLSRPLEEAFLKAELPYQIYSGVQFFERREIRDALAYLRLILYRDDLSFLRVANTPRRNLGSRRMQFLREYAQRERCTLYEALERTVDDPVFKGTGGKKLLALVEEFTALANVLQPSELLALLLDRSGYEASLRLEGDQARLDNLAELKQAVQEYEQTCGEECSAADYLTMVSLMSAADQPDTRQAVRFMTVHTAKGLEFPYVFVCGLSEGIFPSKKTADADGMEEERRLAFVAMTRAQLGLFLSDGEGRNRDGSYWFPSRFVLEISRKHLDYTAELDPALTAGALRMLEAGTRLAEVPAGRFSVGDRVVHSILGDGIILEVDLIRKIYVIQFEELATPRRITMRAKLEPKEGN